MEIGVGLRLLETLTSALYEDPIVLFREYVQNSADAFISNPIKENSRIDISIDKEHKTIVFLDNGYGIAKDRFFAEMTSLGKSQKTKEVDQIGFRGIGRLSAMPFCEKLCFTNKIENESTEQLFEWEGKKYNKLLEQGNEDDLSSVISSIASASEQDYDGDIKEHFFKVEIKNYNEEISDLISANDFKFRLQKLLPLKYAPQFKYAKSIQDHYKKFMNKCLETYEFDVFLNDEPLFKPYENAHILDSDIVFWDLSFKKTDVEDHNSKIGVLWFTFNRKVESNALNSPRGILARSKNMLLGNEYSILSSVTKGNEDYIGTYRDLTQTLNGVYGELLIDTDKLSDNARRDWFRIDSNAKELQTILNDYVKKLKDYRYAASRAFNDKDSTDKRNKLVETFKNLTKGFDINQFEIEFYDKTENSEKKSSFIYADEDIPNYSISNKKFYERIMNLLKKFYSQDGEKINEFIRMRIYIKDNINDTNND